LVKSNPVLQPLQKLPETLFRQFAQFEMTEQLLMMPGGGAFEFVLLVGTLGRITVVFGFVGLVEFDGMLFVEFVTVVIFVSFEGFKTIMGVVEFAGTT